MVNSSVELLCYMPKIAKNCSLMSYWCSVPVYWTTKHCCFLPVLILKSLVNFFWALQTKSIATNHPNKTIYPVLSTHSSSGFNWTSVILIVFSFFYEVIAIIYLSIYLFMKIFIYYLTFYYMYTLFSRHSRVDAHMNWECDRHAQGLQIFKPNWVTVREAGIDTSFHHNYEAICSCYLLPMEK